MSEVGYTVGNFIGLLKKHTAIVLTCIRIGKQWICDNNNDNNNELLNV